MKKTILLVTTVAVLGTGCGSADPEVQSASVVAEVLGPDAATTAPAPEIVDPPVSVPPGCRLEIELDEYGFEVEVVVCGEPEPPPIDNPDWLGSPSAVQASSQLRKAMLQETVCGASVTYERLRNLVADSSPKLRDPLLAAIAALERGALHCNHDRDAWAKEMSEAILRLEEFLQAVEEVQNK